MILTSLLVWGCCVLCGVVVFVDDHYDVCCVDAVFCFCVVFGCDYVCVCVCVWLVLLLCAGICVVVKCDGDCCCCLFGVCVLCQCCLTLHTCLIIYI